MKTPLVFFSVVALFSGWANAQVTDRTWNAGTGSTDFNNTSNYTPSGALTVNTHLIFDSATNPGLTTSKGEALHGLEIRSGASGFVISGSAPTIGNGGVSVADNTTALFNLRLSSHGEATNFTFHVGEGGSATVSGYITPLNRAFYKTGAGTLTLETGMGTTSENFLRSGTAVRIEEGTLIIGDSAVFQSGSTLSVLNIHLGTATSTATLRGGGSFGGSPTAGKTAVLTTYGATRSHIEPAGDGSLFIESLNASAGATFHFELGSSVIEGSGTLTGSTAADNLILNLTGGAVGVEYTLFDYTTLSGVDITDFMIASAGYEVDHWNIANGEVKVTFSTIPEPGTLALGALFMLGCALVHTRRRSA